MFRFLLVMICVLMLLGCSNKNAEVKTKQKTNITKQLVKPWPTEEKHFWTSMMFAQLSARPDVRNRFLPIHLYKTVECIMNEYEKRYDFETWKKNFGLKMSGVLPPEQAQVAYNLTYFCSSIQLQIQQKELQNNFNEKDAI